jgi:hypothetical protein
MGFNGGVGLCVCVCGDGDCDEENVRSLIVCCFVFAWGAHLKDVGSAQKS